MSVDQTIWVGVAVLTFLVVVFMGPGLWSSSTGYPLIERPWKWLKENVFSRDPADGPPPEKKKP